MHRSHQRGIGQVDEDVQVRPEQFLPADDELPARGAGVDRADNSDRGVERRIGDVDVPEHGDVRHPMAAVDHRADRDRHQIEHHTAVSTVTIRPERLSRNNRLQQEQFARIFLLNAILPAEGLRSRVSA